MIRIFRESPLSLPLLHNTSGWCHVIFNMVQLLLEDTDWKNYQWFSTENQTTQKIISFNTLVRLVNSLVKIAELCNNLLHKSKANKWNKSISIQYLRGILPSVSPI